MGALDAIEMGDGQLRWYKNCVYPGLSLAPLGQVSG